METSVWKHVANIELHDTANVKCKKVFCESGPTTEVFQSCYFLMNKKFSEVHVTSWMPVSKV